MSHSELDKPTPVEPYSDESSSNTPIHDFSGLKKLLRSLGYHIPKPVVYRPIHVRDLTQEEIQSGAIEFTDDGIFLNDDNVKLQIFLYKRDYHLKLYGKPRFHIRKCSTIESFMNTAGEIPLYRLANTDTVKVNDIDDGTKDKQVSSLPLCKNCLTMVAEAFPAMTTEDFVELRKNTAEAQSELNTETDIFGYPKDWEIISRAYRTTHDYTCERCGLKIEKPLDQQYIHVHHKNGNKLDNRESNLECLCLRCHANVDEHHYNRLVTSSGANQIIYNEFCEKYPAPR